MFYVSIIVFIGMYILLLYLLKKKLKYHFGPKVSLFFKRVHYVGILFCLILWISNTYYAIDLRGIWTSRIFILTTIISGFLISFFSNKSTKNILDSIYFNLLTGIPILVGGFLLIPFVGAIVVFSLIIQLLNPIDRLYYNDHHLRVQATPSGPMVQARLEVFQKQFIIEKRTKTDEYVQDIDSVNVLYNKDTTLIYLYGTSIIDDKVYQYPIGLPPLK